MTTSLLQTKDGAPVQRPMVRQRAVMAAVVRREAAVGRREAAVVRREAAVGRRKAAVVRREAAVGRQEAAVVRRKAAVGRRTAAVVRRTAAVVRQEAAVVRRVAPVGRQKAAVARQTAAAAAFRRLRRLHRCPTAALLLLICTPPEGCTTSALSKRATRVERCSRFCESCTPTRTKPVCHKQAKSLLFAATHKKVAR